MTICLNDIQADIQSTVKNALREDVGDGDITAQLIPPCQENEATVITREECIVCGTAWFNAVYEQLGGLNTLDWAYQDGDLAPANSTLVTLQGNTRTLLTGERTALNFLQLLSSTATTAKHYARSVKDANIHIMDTRKTIPGLRLAQKYAVAVGGCHNHRIGLYDAFLIKENHILACGGIGEAIRRARVQHDQLPIIVETENVQEVAEAVDACADVIMLDNFSPSDIDQALSRYSGSQSVFEITGNVDLHQLSALRMVQKTITIDQPTSHSEAPFALRVSMGVLTKNISAIDFSMRII